MQDKDGKWYTQSADVDVVGISAIDRGIVVGECKFKNEKMDRGYMKPWFEEVK